MNLSNTCTRYRERERQALKPFLMLSLLGSVALHGGLLVFAASQWQRAELSSLGEVAPDATPVDLIIQQPALESTATPLSESLSPVALSPAAISPAAIDQSPGWSTAAPSTSLQSPTPLPDPDLRSQEESPAPNSISPTEFPATPAGLPLQAEPTALELEAVTPSPLVTASQAESAPAQQPLASLPLLNPAKVESSSQSDLASVPFSTPSSNQPSARSQSPLPFATTFRQWFAPLTGGIAPAQQGGGTGTTVDKSNSGSSPGLGASALGGLVARNLSQGWPQLPGNPATDLSNQTTCLSCSKPAYPVAAQRQGRQGAVKIGLDYDSQGNVTAVRLLQSSGYDDLDRAAIAEAKRWKLKPGNDNKRQFVAAIDFQAPVKDLSESGGTRRQSTESAKGSTLPTATSSPSIGAGRSQESSRSRQDDGTPPVTELETPSTGAESLKQPVGETPTIQPKAEVDRPSVEPVAPPEQPILREAPSGSSSEPAVSDLAAPVGQPPAITSSEGQTYGSVTR